MSLGKVDGETTVVDLGSDQDKLLVFPGVKDRQAKDEPSFSCILYKYLLTFNFDILKMAHIQLIYAPYNREYFKPLGGKIFRKYPKEG